MLPLLTVEALKREAIVFCEAESHCKHNDLMRISDGKSIGTYVEQRFKNYLTGRYRCTVGSSSSGIDLPDPEVNTDIKVTSCNLPQSSCPFKSPRQKIFGLGYNLLVFVYEKNDLPDSCQLLFKACTFIDKSRTADYITTKHLREMLRDGANKEELMAYLADRSLPGDEIAYASLADEILRTPPQLGYLVISNALQWRLHYSRVITLTETVEGITTHAW
ncbi:MAG TPA: restriction endonuclease [Candidatus Avisuccinivibrio pullicola]|nr:restriction endonuclease [Candidatus Avisuccinivibrio pullicola]